MRKRVVAVLAGDAVDIPWLIPWLASADLIFAADGGSDSVLAAGFEPDVLIGDLDSATPEGIANAKEVIRDNDQETSDCDKLLNLMSRRKVESATIVGAEGTRIDHMIGILHSLAKWEGHATVAYRNLLCRTLRGPSSDQFDCSGSISALPLEKCEGVTMKNVQWPLDAVNMAPADFSSLSNHCLGRAEVSVARGLLAVFWAYDGKPVWNPVE